MRILYIGALFWWPFCLIGLGETSSTSVFSAGDIEFFEKDIRPVLADRCYKCHSGTKARVGLQLDHREGWIRGSDYRKVINQAKPGESLVLHAVKQDGKMDAPKMPEKGDPLSSASIGALEQWIGKGLPWPSDQAGKSQSNDPRKHWSFQPVEAPSIPKDPGHPIDYFIRKKLADKGVSPAPQADHRILYRRLSYDLLGLPPKFDELQSFLDTKQDHATAWPKLVDHFLSSPHYGERWARHWMDVARYSDTKGYEAASRDRRFIHSYTYRDWLIRAFNEDLPFDKFLLYQLAAEQLVDWKGPEKQHLAAMGFISLSKNGRQELVIDDRLDTTFRGMMGLTVSCARCHDHKFDPISTQEYYGLFGVFRNSLASQQPVIGEIPKTPEYEAYLKDLAQERKKVSDFLDPRLAELKKKFPKLAGNEAALRSKLDGETRKKVRDMQIKVDKFIANRGMEPAKALIVTDPARPSPQHVYIRGNSSRRGEIVPLQFPEIASRGEPVVFKKGSGRLEMAQQIASPDNPLTARVIVNRVWMWHFGGGLVRTVSDFGTQGEKPSHPELLDWLANWFVENGWSIKKLSHLILTSQTWQQSADNPGHEKWMLLDPENRLLWRSFRRRLDFEQMRDSFLAAAKNLDNTMYGRTVKILEPPFSNRRSVYAFIDRQNLNPVFRHFDFSNPQETTGQRPNTTIPMQALFTMNAPFVMKQASNLSQQTESAKDRVAALHRAVLTRDPSPEDRLLADSFFRSYDRPGEKVDTQNLSGWSYGWGSFDSTGGKVTFEPFRHWDAKGRDWRIQKEFPVKDSPKSYLHIGARSQHPGLGDKFASILRWHSPRNMKITIDGVLSRPAVNKGRSGFLIHVVSSKQGSLLSTKLPVSQRDIPIQLSDIEVGEDEMICFVVDCDGDTSFDTYHWDPIVSNAGNPGERWKMSVDFGGPETPLNAWEAYAHALLNTNRFLFID